jgi:hypothetical protein
VLTASEPPLDSFDPPRTSAPAPLFAAQRAYLRSLAAANAPQLLTRLSPLLDDPLFARADGGDDGGSDGDFEAGDDHAAAEGSAPRWAVQEEEEASEWEEAPKASLEPDEWDLLCPVDAGLRGVLGARRARVEEEEEPWATEFGGVDTKEPGGRQEGPAAAGKRPRPAEEDLSPPDGGW